MFSRGTRQAPTLAAPLRAPMSECDYKIHNIYSTLIYIKTHSRIHPIKLFFKKNSRKSIPSNPLAMKMNSAVYAPYERQRKRGVLQYLPLSKNNTPQCLNIDLYPPPPPVTIGYVTIMPCYSVPTRENFPLHHWYCYEGLVTRGAAVLSGLDSRPLWVKFQCFAFVLPPIPAPAVRQCNTCKCNMLWLWLWLWLWNNFICTQTKQYTIYG